MVTFTTIDDGYSTEICSSFLSLYPESLLTMMWKWAAMPSAIKVHHLTAANLLELARFYQTNKWSNPWLYDSSKNLTTVVDGVEDYLWNYCNLPFDIIDELWSDSDSMDWYEEDCPDDFVAYCSISDEENDEDVFYSEKYVH
jgi:hypothetical protein